MDMTTEPKAIAGKIAATFNEAAAPFNAGMAEATAGFEKTQAQIKEQMSQAMKKAEEMASFNQGTVDAVLKSGQILATGMQDLSKQMVATAQTQFTETVSTFKALAGMRSIKDLMELQANYARAAMEKMMSETGRMTDAGFKLAEEAMAPLTARVSLAVETLTKPN